MLRSVTYENGTDVQLETELIKMNTGKQIYNNIMFSLTIYNLLIKVG